MILRVKIKVLHYITFHNQVSKRCAGHFITSLLPWAEPTWAQIAPTQTIATLCGPALPLLPLRRKVQSSAGLPTLYLSHALSALGASSGASGGASEPGAYGWYGWYMSEPCKTSVSKDVIISGTWLVLSKITSFGTCVVLPGDAKDSS